MATQLGEITLLAQVKWTPPPGVKKESAVSSQAPQDKTQVIVIDSQGVSSSDGRRLEQTFSAGSLPSPSSAFDREITFGTPLPTVDWATGERQRDGAAVGVHTRPSVLYTRLFASLGDYTRGVEYILFSIAILFAIIELVALIVGTRLTRTITAAIAQLYDATIAPTSAIASASNPATNSPALRPLSIP
jgi:hypothetical protein